MNSDEILGILLPLVKHSVIPVPWQVGRRSLDRMVRNLLVSDKVGESLVKGLVEIFSKLHPLSTRINQLAEIISEIREPLCRTVQHTLTEEEERMKSLKVSVREV